MEQQESSTSSSSYTSRAIALDTATSVSSTDSSASSSSSSSPSSTDSAGYGYDAESGGAAGVIIEASNITVKVPAKKSLLDKCRGRPGTDEIVLLDNVSLKLVPGELTMLLGPSSSGKSLLLDVLAGRLPSALESSGSVLYNGMELDPSDVMAISGYVQQEDIMLSDSTPRENLHFLARLSLPSTMSAEDRGARVESVLNSLGIAKVGDTLVGVPGLKRGLSGGERKRANIAQSLITAPQILYVDDPTAGLDAATAETVIVNLRKLAKKNNMTILASISQASNEMLHIFDNVMALAGGQVAYSGKLLSRTALVPGDDETAHSGSSSASTSASSSLARIQAITAAARAAGMGLPDSSSASLSQAGSLQLDEFKGHRPSPIVKLAQLVKRNIMLQVRNKQASWARAGQMIILGFLIAAIWYQIDRGQTGGLDRAGLIFLVTIMLVFSGMHAAVTLFIPERAVFMRESQDGLYSTVTYLAAKVIADLPFQAAYIALYVFQVYFMVGLQAELDKFLIFTGFAYQLSLFGTWLGLLLSAATGDSDAANALAPGIVLPSTLFASFLVKPESIWVGIRWLRYFSFMKYAFNGVLINELKGLTFTCDASEAINGTCPVPNGQAVLDLFEAEEDGNIGFNSGILGVFMALFLILSYLALNASRKR
ncbi:ATP-binding cassette sub-family G member 2 [Thecamonas trahens ATCC 50062]|uniref:ATP-binding cassette sub-family G member 2 n=1 Tax=Thecamonas trahens ATCC 50062 TaxID=461836 RepID=A0A0L0D300_THETB|nr:ATP-binding cassette sub-family G member 2 [Thecamonas trahens ATCC 50062]KNC46674.1 ATP-binding cassette sub-family G member 2 [Thecamonas trahens ATCC 50062]|eukprot:XP_013760444.1 ATP-binding cassette sub-family G member 2 [Thecamonas trahens ATCC 50062]